MLPPHPTSTLFPYTTLFRSNSGSTLIRPCSSTAPAKRTLTAMCGLLLPPCFRSCARHPTFSSCRATPRARSEEHTSELQSRFDLVCRLLLEKKKTLNTSTHH